MAWMYYQKACDIVSQSVNQILGVNRDQ